MTGPLNYTTAIPVAKTVGEVQHLLAAAGADAVMVRYTERQPTAVSFALRTPHGDRQFTLPINVDGVHRLLVERHRSGRIKAHVGKGLIASPEHAARVAWRVAKDWLEAQLAIIDAQMATLDQVMLPYLQVEGDLTLYEVYRQHEARALPAGAA